MNVTELFKAALCRMLDEGEFGGNIRWPHPKRAARDGRALGVLRGVHDDFADVPLVALLSVISDADVLKDALVHMVICEGEGASDGR